MSVENTIREVVPEDWDVIPKSSLDDIELRLLLCTGFIAYSLTDKNAPYLIVHSGPTQMGGILPVLAMFEVMNSRNFRSHTKDINQMSLNEILDHYKRQFMEQYDEEIDARLGIYIFSGCRVNPTDLAILRHFLLDENSNLMGLN